MAQNETVWGLRLAPLTLAGTVDAVSTLVEAGAPSYLITANTNYAMLTARDARLRAVNAGAALIVADGAPLVWASRWHGTPVPERVAGSDLIFALCARAAERGFGVYLLGGTADVNQEAASRLSERYPGLRIVGTDAPPHRPLSAKETAALRDRVRAAQSRLPHRRLRPAEGGVLDRGALRSPGSPRLHPVRRDPRFRRGTIPPGARALQRAGLEWAFRLALEPSRLFNRYARNAGFVLGQCARDLGRTLLVRIVRTSP